jgi:hypothetical protein
MSWVISIVSGEGEYEKVEGYYGGWAYNAHGHPDGFKLVSSIDEAEKFDTKDMAQVQVSGDQRLKGAKIVRAEQ